MFDRRAWDKRISVAASVWSNIKPAEREMILLEYRTEADAEIARQRGVICRLEGENKHFELRAKLAEAASKSKEDQLDEANQKLAQFVHGENEDKHWTDENPNENYVR